MRGDDVFVYLCVCKFGAKSICGDRCYANICSIGDASVFAPFPSISHRSNDDAQCDDGAEANGGVGGVERVRIRR